MRNLLDDIAVIGAGLGGCALALALSAHNIPITIYELRDEDAPILNSGVILTPNGLRVLDFLGVFDRVKDRCYKATYRNFKNAKDETVRSVYIANEQSYGYCNHRIWRRILLKEMRGMLVERQVTILYNTKFEGIVYESKNEGVDFTVNGQIRHASLLIGSDGIYSRVRSHLSPDIIPEYTGIIGLLSHIPRASVAWPYEDYVLNFTLQDKPGALVIMPEDPEAVDIMVAMQVHHPEQSRKDLDDLQADKERLVSFYTKAYDQWGPTARKIIDQVVAHKENCFIWPYMRMPKIPRWYSENSGRVILLGDGAHGQIALPPSSGQGVNQALEDVYSLVTLLTSLCGSGANNSISDGNGLATAATTETLLEGLAFWQDLRQKRIDAVFDWTMNASNLQRLPEAERQRLLDAGKHKGPGDDMSWLYGYEVDEEIRAWVQQVRI
ncbi:hypothetical protein BAUCODRAFT_530137 [Baudoinia panamericana UAMH 10762]|uniref:FAD-binding domain-containing protein n=1 Tax=Baudoinia panamericana (strain UAMH 10762) TaxID=717646 RepID=M2MUD0_BAUPA|nr:uncharacterized protein BAUCODRAFT_530137 [Baudoinia panamericana UAMH 10762]EMC95178.1 hypothetical protein BAUCODRAFT_530137 [Baudoinia panamericana UAMH 10762]